MNEIHDIVYVKTEGYSASNNQAHCLGNRKNQPAVPE